MRIRRVLVVSGEPLASHGLKALLEKAGRAEVGIASEEELLTGGIGESVPEVVVIDRAASEGRPFETDYPAKLVVIGPGDDRMAVYSRQDVHEATVDNLLHVLCQSNGVDRCAERP